MMKTVEIQDGQTLVDIAMQELGDAERVFELAELNGIAGVTAELTAGMEVLVPDAENKKKSVVNVFARSKNKTASGDSYFIDIGVISTDEGIEFWKIEDEFKVT